MRESKYVMMLPAEDISQQNDWEKLENEIEVAYLDQQRGSREALQRETELEDGQREFRTSK
jgi:hypothetical protein